MIPDDIRPVAQDTVGVGEATETLDRNGLILILWICFLLYLWWGVV